jgi:hypothetical protein
MGHTLIMDEVVFARVVVSGVFRVLCRLAARRCTNKNQLQGDTSTAINFREVNNFLL